MHKAVIDTNKSQFLRDYLPRRKIKILRPWLLLLNREADNQMK